MQKALSSQPHLAQFWLLAAVFASTGALARPPMPTPQELAKPGGWASQGVNGLGQTGTSGGAAALPADIYTVSTPAQLKAALAVPRSKIIRIQGLLDLSDGLPYANHNEQKLRSNLRLNSNTTVIGLGSTAKIINGWFTIASGVDNVIMRNFTIQNPCDVAPVWDPSDGASGNWNSEWDGLTIDRAKHVWIDHLSFTDGDLTDDKLPIENGKTKQCHDGALDIKNAADYVTVSNNVFEYHNKNNLIGQSDSNGPTDEGHQTITFNNNLFRHIGQRAPRVRFAMLHAYNNLFVGSKAHPVYPHSYSIGVGKNAKIYAQNNVFNIEGALGCLDVIRNPASAKGNILETGSSINGVPLNPAQCVDSGTMGNAVTWLIPYPYVLLPTAQVTKKVTVNAGAGRMEASTLSR